MGWLGISECEGGGSVPPRVGAACCIRLFWHWMESLVEAAKVNAGAALKRLCLARFETPTRHTRARYAGAASAIWSPIMNKHLVTVDPEIHSGTPVFAGTRVPIKTLFDHLEAGDALDVFLDDFPSVSRDLAVAVLEEARAALAPDAHPA